MVERHTELLERDGELATFTDVVDRARAGAGGVLVVEGPAGIGKTRLLAVALRGAHAAGLSVAAARGSELERDFPFGVVRQLLEPLVAVLPAAERSELLAGPAALGASALSDLTPEGTARASDVSYATLHGLYWLTANLASEGPLLIAVDDAHWSDAPSLRFLAYLAQRIEGLPVCVALVRRPAELGTEAEVLEAIAADPVARLVKPAALSESAVTELVRAGLSADADQSFGAACHRATGGNPFLLRELLRTLAEDGTGATRADAARVSQVAPDSVVRSMGRRLERLPADAAALARAVAILGDAADPRIAAGLADLDPLAAAEAAESLARIDVFQRGESLTFSHPLTRAAVYSSLSPAGRAAASRRAAQLLRHAGADLDRIAVHLLATESPGEAWELEVLRAAARAAVSSGAPDAAATFLERALREPLADEARADLMVELGVSEVAAIPPPTGIDHLRQAQALTRDPLKRATIALELGRALSQSVDFESAAEVLEHALLAPGPGDRELADRLEAQLMMTSIMSLSTAPRAYRRFDRLASAVEAGAVDDPVLLADAALFTSNVMEPAAKGAGIAERALAGGRLITETDPLTIVFVACSLMFANRLDTTIALLDEALAQAGRSGSVPLFVFASGFRSHAHWRRGSIASAEADARAALDIDAVRDAPAGFAVTTAVLIDALIERGELDEAAQALAGSGIGGPLPELLPLGFVLDTRGRLRLAQGRAREALDDFLECGRRAAGWRARNPGALPWRVSAALAHTALGERDQALVLAREEIELARIFEVPRELGMALRAAGLAAGGADGIEHLREAVDVLERSPARLEHARALIDLGGAIRRSGRRAEAREPLRQGLELAQRCGADALARRAHDELVAAGARPRRVAVTGVDALTASERRVAEMAAQGMTNRQIAQALFVTEKTIEWHLGQAYRKLDIHSRSELGTNLAGPGLPQPQSRGTHDQARVHDSPPRRHDS